MACYAGLKLISMKVTYWSMPFSRSSAENMMQKFQRSVETMTKRATVGVYKEPILCGLPIILWLWC